MDESRMKLLISLPKGPIRDQFLSPDLVRRLERCATLAWNEGTRHFRPEELGEALVGMDACLTGWDVPTIDPAVLARADRLSLVAHLGGTVAPVVTRDVYERGVRVCSGNQVMARVVAEAILGFMLSGRRNLPWFNQAMHEGKPWPRERERSRSLLGASIGFVGLGSIGRELLNLLAAFSVRVHVFDPYIEDNTLDPWPFATRCGLEACLEEAEVISLHASRTPETVGLLGSAELGRIRDGALLINAARGALVDEAALLGELASKRIAAVLDVYWKEPLPADHPLRSMDHVILTPHMAGAPSHAPLAEAMVTEIERAAAGEPLAYEIPLEQFERMTR